MLRVQVYKRGYRPVLGTILHSPSLHVLYMAEEAMRLWREETPTLIKLTETGDLDTMDIPITLKTLYQGMRYCILCGAEMTALVADIKSCPQGHGKMYPWESPDKGTPGVFFDPYPDE
jgi:hypothetical protein